jgi:hypothetical protein
MELILLGGNSKLNKGWIEEVEKTLSDIFDSTHFHYYRHWENEEDKDINLAYELEKLAEYIQGKNDYVIFAKSAGTLLTLKGIFEGKIQPNACIFTGLAFTWAKHKKWDLDNWLENYNIPTLFIQKTNDPAISYQDLKQELGNHHVINHIAQEIPGDDHHYENVGELKVHIQKFLHPEA